MNDRTNTGAEHLIHLAVYGTLMHGFWNYERYCKGAASIEKVTIRGKLYALPSGIPVLQVPDECILAHGTSDPIADVDTQERFEPDEYATPDEAGDWVNGELMTFYDPETRLPMIDRLEGFRPGAPSLYRRVLVHVYSGAEAIPAWCYVAGEFSVRDMRPTGKVMWP